MLRILQWNICGLRGNINSLKEAVVKEEIDVVHLQETLTTDETTPKLQGFEHYTLPHSDERRGLTTLIKRSIPQELLEQPTPCGEGVEVLAIKIHRPPSIQHIQKPKVGAGSL
ncbi:hypothetical protein Pcinc_018574 [Petrolisthes cinctipes]|uniref:Endonuclease/exonuclease/phosphatase domain-containing protein n=1 Tax=Petrolisthes cinctipes TaxID=88211 RepID=A0AAE1FLW5_PETCI|nr:hypothetical protein Pcinc_018574 [Petrolisthes cinctipes]